MPMVDMPIRELEQYNGMNPRPADHDAYWDNAIAEMKAIDPQITMTKAAFQAPNAECYDLYFTGVNGARVYAKHARPKNITGKIPAVVMFHGYSGDSGSWMDKIAYAANGFAVFALAAVLGTFLGKIKIPLSSAGLDGTCFSLTTTGGCLLASLIFGHLGRIGRLNIMPDQHTLKLFRALGLVLFLVGAGIPGGAEFVATFDVMYFVYGIIMTIVPMILGYLFARYVLKLSLLNNLGALTGGMTSTPALGTLISTAGTEDVAAAYAATYPIALIAVVLVSQFLIILF